MELVKVMILWTELWPRRISGQSAASCYCRGSKSRDTAIKTLVHARMRFCDSSGRDRYQCGWLRCRDYEASPMFDVINVGQLTRIVFWLIVLRKRKKVLNLKWIYLHNKTGNNLDLTVAKQLVTCFLFWDVFYKLFMCFLLWKDGTVSMPGGKYFVSMLGETHWPVVTDSRAAADNFFWNLVPTN